MTTKMNESSPDSSTRNGKIVWKQSLLKSKPILRFTLNLHSSEIFIFLKKSMACYEGKQPLENNFDFVLDIIKVDKIQNDKELELKITV